MSETQAKDRSNPFWMVWSPRGGPPRRRHSALADAQAEATRLSARFHGRHFYVLQMVDYRIVGEPTLTERQIQELTAKQEAATVPDTLNKKTR